MTTQANVPCAPCDVVGLSLVYPQNAVINEYLLPKDTPPSNPGELFIPRPPNLVALQVCVCVCVCVCDSVCCVALSNIVFVVCVRNLQQCPSKYWNVCNHTHLVAVSRVIQ